MRDNPTKPAKQFRGVSPGNFCQLTVRDLIANLIVAAMTTTHAVIAGMRPVPADQRIYRVKLRVAEEADK